MKEGQRIFGAKKENRVWRILYNFELQQKYKKPNIIKVIKVSQLKGLCPVHGLDDKSSLKKLVFSKSVRKKKEGKTPNQMAGLSGDPTQEPWSQQL